MTTHSSQPAGDDRGHVYISYFGGTPADSSGGVSAVKLQAFARRNTPDRPFGVVNDFVASSLGLAIGLPVPPGRLMPVGKNEMGYVSLSFTDRGDEPPPVIFSEFAQQCPWEASGVIAFDQWVLNSDRHSSNLAYLPELGVAVFDHDLSLFGRVSSEDLVRVLLESSEQELKGHPLPRHMRTAEYLSDWCDRISSVSPREIGRHLNVCVNANLITTDQAFCLKRFLEHRQHRIKLYLERTRVEYTGVTSWPLESGGAF